MRGMRALVVVAAIALTAACSSTPSSTSSGTSRSPAPAASSVSGRDIGLQLRPVLAADATTGSTCIPSGSPIPTVEASPTQSPITACSTDGSIVYSLGPAVVLGDQWESLRLDDSQGEATIVAVLDPSGSTALTKATADLATEDTPKNQLAFYARGYVVSAPSVTQPIYGGVAVIAGGWTQAEAQDLVDQLAG